MYHKLWSESDPETLGIACREYMLKGNNKFFPRAGEILDIIMAWSKPTGALLEANAQQQWRIVLDAIRQRGEAKGPPIFKDPLTNTIVRIQFGWQYLCNVLVDKLNWEEKRFVEAYNLASEIPRDDLLLEATTEDIKQLISGIGDTNGKD